MAKATSESPRPTFSAIIDREGDVFTISVEQDGKGAVATCSAAKGVDEALEIQRRLIKETAP